MTEFSFVIPAERGHCRRGQVGSLNHSMSCRVYCIDTSALYAFKNERERKENKISNEHRELCLI